MAKNRIVNLQFRRLTGEDEKEAAMFAGHHRPGSPPVATFIPRYLWELMYKPENIQVTIAVLEDDD